MYLYKLVLNNFRNFSRLDLNFARKLTILVGPNGSGKTNLLESILFLGFAKSYRVHNDKNLIKLKQSFASVSGEFKSFYSKDLIKSEVIFGKINKNPAYKKVVKINGVIKTPLDLIKKSAIVLFCPEHLNLATDLPEKRRRYLDAIISQVDQNYYKNLIGFKKILKNKNQVLLKIKRGEASVSELEFWDKKIIELGKYIIFKRSSVIDFYNSKINSIYNEISGSLFSPLTLKHKLQIEYRPCPGPSSLKNINLIAANIERELKIKRQMEIERSASLIGPHRDDFDLLLNNNDLAQFGSRGEIRSAILALKFIEIIFIEQEKKEKPILLLDDAFSELDKLKRKSIEALINRQQTIITITDASNIGEKLTNQAEILLIKGGQLHNIK